jgi:predicted DNA-binding transcriptional regulator AlpA
MEKHEQRFVIKFLWICGLARSAIYQQLENSLDSTAFSEESVENWMGDFVSGDRI